MNSWKWSRLSALSAIRIAWPHWSQGAAFSTDASPSISAGSLCRVSRGRRHFGGTRASSIYGSDCLLCVLIIIQPCRPSGSLSDGLVAESNADVGHEGGRELLKRFSNGFGELRCLKVRVRWTAKLCDRVAT